MSPVRILLIETSYFYPNVDPILKFTINGVELRLYNAHRYLKLTHIFYKKKIYSIDKWLIKLYSIIIPTIKQINDIYNYYNTNNNTNNIINIDLQKKIDEYKNKNNIQFLILDDNNLSKLINYVLPKQFTHDDFYESCNTIKIYCINKFSLEYIKHNIQTGVNKIKYKIKY